jgi:hypothetical protein
MPERPLLLFPTPEVTSKSNLGGGVAARICRHIFGKGKDWLQNLLSYKKLFAPVTSRSSKL